MPVADFRLNSREAQIKQARRLILKGDIAAKIDKWVAAERDYCKVDNSEKSMDSPEYTVTDVFERMAISQQSINYTLKLLD